MSLQESEPKLYVGQALKTFRDKDREFTPFAPLQHKLSALHTVTPSQSFLFATLTLIYIVLLLIYRTQTLITTIAVITIFYLGIMVLNFILAAKSLSKASGEEIDENVIHTLVDVEWPKYTILCPLFRETEVVAQFVQAMLSLDYPTDKLEILVITEPDDLETRQALCRIQLPNHFKILTVPAGQPRTKPRACNYGLLHATGEYVVIYDAEDIPDSLQLKKAVLTFARHGPHVACVQAKLSYYNTSQNLLTLWSTIEYSLLFELTLPGMQQVGFPLPLAGTSNHFRAESLRSLGAWDAFNVTEDCDLGLRIARYDLTTVMLDSTTFEEANSKVRNWLRQRSRWIKGYIQTYLVHTREPFFYLRFGSLRKFLSLHLIIGGKTAVLFINPLMWGLLVVYLLFPENFSDAYHRLFPTPIFYAGIVCLIFGNFLHIYTHVIGCIKQNRPDLIKYSVFIPVYWFMASIAAFLALVQLLLKPHYWEKTQHGLHLSSLSSYNTFHENETSNASKLSQSQASSPEHLIASSTVLLSKTHQTKHNVSDAVRRLLLNDTWFLITIVTGITLSTLACLYFFLNQQILLYGDAYSHLSIARRVFDSPTPGLAQLGGVWLPLPHLLMLPFVWNDYLWRTGLAGSILSMLCYIVSSIYLYLAARRLTSSGIASYIGSLVFLLNPNILYLQSTPLSELVSVATFSMACYYFLAWIHDDRATYLILSGVGTFLATLVRYDGWLLFGCLLIFITLVGWRRRQKWMHIEGNILTFGLIGGLGIALWMLWCAIIFGDPLYFQRGPFSSQTQTLLYTNELYTYHNLIEALRYYLLLSINILGPILFALALISFFIFISKKGFRIEILAILAYLVPFAFYVLSLYTGQVALFLPDAVPVSAPQKLFNVRYGVAMVVPLALLIAILAGSWPQNKFPKHLFTVKNLLLTSVIIVQVVLITKQGIITLQDGQYGGSRAVPHSRINAYLAEHYSGGLILNYVFASKFDGIQAGIDLKDIIYEGSGQLWEQALKKPASVVEWIIVRPHDKNDPVAASIDWKGSTFSSQFILVAEEPDGLSLFRKRYIP
jgi:cellulose synthase/poly-beta-1,6-N-acetylglucosamine synthase-like glycosyltransferase